MQEEFRDPTVFVSQASAITLNSKTVAKSEESSSWQKFPTLQFLWDFCLSF